MSADPTLMQDESRIVQDTAVSRNQAEGRAPLTQEEFSPRPLEQSLNAEEATVLVLKFLRRMGKQIVTPRKAVPNDDVFVVDVDLREASATVRINANTREISEYYIEPHPKEVKPLSIPSKKIIIMLGAVFAGVLIFIFQKVLILYAGSIMSMVSSDHLIIGGALALVAALVIWWRRRE